MSSKMKDLVEYIAKEIVNNPDDVMVEEYTGEDNSVNLTLSVNPEDMGLVIGKNGQTIKSIRKLIIVRAMAENQRVSLSLKEPAANENEQVQKEPEEISQEAN